LILAVKTTVVPESTWEADGTSRRVAGSGVTKTV
jgi:hypothetical protein